MPEEFNFDVEDEATEVSVVSEETPDEPSVSEPSVVSEPSADEPEEAEQASAPSEDFEADDKPAGRGATVRYVDDAGNVVTGKVRLSRGQGRIAIVDGPERRINEYAVVA